MLEGALDGVLGGWSMPRFFSQSVVPTAVSSSGALAGVEGALAPLSQSISSFGGSVESEDNQPVVPGLPPATGADSSDCSQSVVPTTDFPPGAAGAGTVGEADSVNQSGRSI